MGIKDKDFYFHNVDYYPVEIVKVDYEVELNVEDDFDEVVLNN